jgi:RNA polymerase sigma-70 factor (ECF subfamily)
MPDEDAQLMVDFRNGNEAAFDSLFQKYFPSVVNVVYRYTGDRAGAEDLAQEVFLRVWRSADRYEPSAKFSTWLFTIVTNLCLNEIRNRAKRPRLDVDREDMPEPAAADNVFSVEEQAGGTELQSRIRQALDELPDTQRMAVLLSKYENLSYKEIADTMDLSIPAVKSLLSRARDGLKEQLSDFL